MPHTPRRPLPPRAFALAALFAAGVAIAAPADVVILKDGFTIQGTVIKESEARYEYLQSGWRDARFDAFERNLMIDGLMKRFVEEIDEA